MDKHIDLLLLRYDESRVWWHDTEADVMAGNGAYRQAIWEWATISRGAFLPTEVDETWASDEGPVNISLTVKGQLVQIRARYLGDYLDMGVLQSINRLVEETGMQFKVYEVFDQSVFVIMLKANEAELLERERGWRFENSLQHLGRG